MAVVGGNGSGKSTLLRVLAGADTALDGGEVQVRKGVRVGFLSQEPHFPEEATALEARALLHGKSPPPPLHSSTPPASAHIRPPLSVCDRFGCTHMLSPRPIPHSPQALLSTDHPKVTALRSYRAAAAAADAAPEDTALALALAEAAHEMDEANAWATEAAVETAIEELGCGPFADRPCGALSGGQTKRLALASVLLQEPELLILDEPTNHLSVQGVEWLETRLADPSLTVLMARSRSLSPPRSRPAPRPHARTHALAGTVRLPVSAGRRARSPLSPPPLHSACACLRKVSHDRSFIDSVCNEVLELDGSGGAFRHRRAPPALPERCGGSRAACPPRAQPSLLCARLTRRRCAPVPPVSRPSALRSGNYTRFLEERENRFRAQEAAAANASTLLRKEAVWMSRQPKARQAKSKSRQDNFYALKDKAQCAAPHPPQPATLPSAAPRSLAPSRRCCALPAQPLPAGVPVGSVWGLGGVKPASRATRSGAESLLYLTFRPDRGAVAQGASRADGHHRPGRDGRHPHGQRVRRAQGASARRPPPLTPPKAKL